MPIFCFILNCYISLWPAAVKIFKKHQYAPPRTHKKRFPTILPLLAIMVTDFAYRKCRLGKPFLEKIVPATSKNWPYYTDLLIFCLQFKHSLACEYLNYYNNITNDCWAIPEKFKRGGLWTYFFQKKIPWTL